MRGSPGAFDPGRCDLCGSRAGETIGRVRTGRSMLSDRRLLARDLWKLACRRCGLVRDGWARTPADLARYYASEYVEHAGEHVFYTAEGPVPRSRVLVDWMRGVALGAWEGSRRCLEVGAGAGHTLREVARQCPEKEVAGSEPGREAARRARRRGAPRVRVSVSQRSGPFDLVYAVAVLEHVASPTRFLRSLHARLRPGGILVLCQPTQDVPSTDVLFADHLHHFASAHVRALGAKCGFVERAVSVGHALMPNFSLHVLASSEPPRRFAWEGPPAVTTCRSTLGGLVDDMRRLDALLDELRESTSVAVFGLSEVYALCRAYSRLPEFPLACGLDDRPEQTSAAAFGFPVVRPEDAPLLGVKDVILTMNRVFYPRVRERLGRLGLAAHPVLVAA